LHESSLTRFRWRRWQNYAALWRFATRQVEPLRAIPTTGGPNPGALRLDDDGDDHGPSPQLGPDKPSDHAAHDLLQLVVVHASPTRGILERDLDLGEDRLEDA